MSIDQAIEVFVHGYSRARSSTHPYEVSRFGPLWVMADGLRKAPPYRVTEFVTSCLEPEEALSSADQVRSGDSDAMNGRSPAESIIGRYRLSAISPATEPDEETKSRFKAAGCRLSTTEGLFVRDLGETIQGADDSRVYLVETKEQAVELKDVRGKWLIRLKDLGIPSIRQYAARIGGRPVAWACSFQIGSHSWVSNLYVSPEHRRTGVATAVMCRMLADDRAAGVKHSVLLASHAGAMLYPRLGYERIGTLHMFQLPRLK